MPAKGFKRVAQWGRHWLGPFERLARPRFEQLAGRRAERAIGVALSVFCVSILTPLPLTNSAPGFAVALTAIGLAERDGLFVGIGLVFGTLWIAGLIGLAVFGVGALGALF
ncbi:MAG: exopolysaccharide biosynthesis protein [Maricaulaceae bacterium]